MKYIFDFDNVIFFTSQSRKERLFPLLEDMGISREDLEQHYQKARASGFSMKKFLADLSTNKDLYDEVMDGSEKYANTELIEAIKKLGRDNCYIVTYGDKDYQLQKINRLHIEPLFSEIIVVTEEYKKEVIEKICAEHADEGVMFIDDKQKHFDELDFTKCPNLKTILYTGQDIKSLLLP
jgi:FMN phosphatase YigB (HAD superfamily)